ncbi:unnamed protein product [Rotaria sp. Silwood2]|nr:unnamed protein product [Rotaria sp. Silwood2]CAF4340638.1 unnamed protein product [Rotaria sp. Silwood2]
MIVPISQWLRIREISLSNDEPETAWTVMSNPRPNDIEQGYLGNCWFMAALTLITERPRMLSHILLTQTYNLSIEMQNLNRRKEYRKALDLFYEYEHKNKEMISVVAINQALKSLTNIKDFQGGLHIYEKYSSRIEKNNYIVASLIHFYNTIEADVICWVHLINASSNLGMISICQSIFGQIPKSVLESTYIKNALIDMWIGKQIY